MSARGVQAHQLIRQRPAGWRCRFPAPVSPHCPGLSAGWPLSIAPAQLTGGHAWGEDLWAAIGKAAGQGGEQAGVHAAALGQRHGFGDPGCWRRQSADCTPLVTWPQPTGPIWSVAGWSAASGARRRSMSAAAGDHQPAFARRRPRRRKQRVHPARAALFGQALGKARVAAGSMLENPPPACWRSAWRPGRRRRTSPV